MRVEYNEENGMDEFKWFKHVEIVREEEWLGKNILVEEREGDQGGGKMK